jgi:hypothetical protein
MDIFLLRTILARYGQTSGMRRLSKIGTVDFFL